MPRANTLPNTASSVANTYSRRMHVLLLTSGGVYPRGRVHDGADKPRRSSAQIVILRNFLRYNRKIISRMYEPLKNGRILLAPPIRAGSSPGISHSRSPCSVAIADT